MSDEKKADGYVAWHPNTPHAANATLSRNKEDALNILYYMMNVSSFEQLMLDGWRIRPVKLLFLDED